jgi:hypothetical protein
VTQGGHATLADQYRGIDSLSRLIFFRASGSVGKVAGGHTVGIGRKAFKFWLTTSIVWIIAIQAVQQRHPARPIATADNSTTAAATP